MPADARDYLAAMTTRPAAPDGTAPDTEGQLVRHVESYTDPTGRPMRGRVTLTDSTAVPPVPTTVELVDGVLEVNLPAGVYRAYAQLRTAGGDRLIRTSYVSIGAQTDA